MATTPAKAKKKLNPYSKRTIIPFRVDNDELQQILTKAQLYTKGNVSDLLRVAVETYRPVKRVTR